MNILNYKEEIVENGKDLRSDVILKYAPQLSDLLKGLNYIIFFLDEKFNVFYVNDGAKKFFKYFVYRDRKLELEGKNLFELFSELDEVLVKYYLENGLSYQTKYLFHSCENKTRVLILRIFLLKTENEKVFLLFGQDVTEFIGNTFNLELAPKFDKLTGLPNLPTFLETAQKNLFSFSTSKNKYAGVLVLDIYNFSAINNLYGFQAGNTILRETSLRLTRILGDKTLIGRTSADEFTVFISNLKQKEDIFQYFELIGSIFEIPFRVNKGNSDFLMVHYNLGTAIYPLDGKDIDVLYQKAQAACNFAKKKGLNQVQLFDIDLSEELQKKVTTENLISESINNDWFVFFVQPYFERTKFQLAGAEALVRIIKPDGEIILPGYFIQTLEKSIYLERFETWVFENALELQKHLKIPISINLTSSTFYNIEFFTKRQEKLKSLSLPLILEITERVAIEKPQQAKETIKYLKSFPMVKIAIDDFGTGYNGLTYLKDVLVDIKDTIIKIDISFVRELKNEDLKTKQLVKAIIDLAHTFGAKTLAEGVETEEQLEILYNLGCDFFQGFYFEKPVPIETFKKKYCLW
jgi:diguanylate cyclase (GGDEF)-like protein